MANQNTPLSHNIRLLRKKHHLSQEKLASKLGINRSNIAAYESKNVEPRLRIILEMARLFNIRLQDFIEKKLSYDGPYPEFETQVKAGNEPGSNLPLDTQKNGKAISRFIESSQKIRKILEGFKAFYNFRKERIREKSPERTKLMFDIENFIQLTEYLLSQNERVIQSLQTDQTD